MASRKTNNIDGLSERHVAQIIRRKMIQKVRPSGKVYSRKKDKNNNPQES